MLTQYGSKSPNSLHVRTCAIITEQDLVQAIEIFKLSEDDLCYLVERAVHIYPNKLPIIHAVKYGSIKLVKQMLKIGADLNIRYDKDHEDPLPNSLNGFTPLIQAILIENVQIVELLLEHPEIDLNLVYTCSCLYTRIIELEGNTPLKIAKMKTSQNSEKIIQLLENRGALLEQQSSWHNLPTSQLISKFLTIEIIPIIEDQEGEPYLILEFNEKRSASFIGKIDVGTIINFKQVYKNVFGNSLDPSNVLNFEYLAECSWSTQYNSFYGNQLYYVKLPTKSLDSLIENENLLVCKLKELTTLTSSSITSISAYVNSVLIALQRDPEHNSYVLAKSKIAEIQENWVTEKQKLLKLQQAIETKNPDSITACLLEQQDYDLSNVYFYDNYPPEMERKYEGIVRAIDLAIYYENIDCVFVLLKNIIESNNDKMAIDKLDVYRYIKLSFKQNNTKLLDLIINTNYKYKFLFKEYILEKTNIINSLISEYDSSADVKNWFLEYHKSQQLGSPISSNSLRLANKMSI